jgi:peptidoglycan hydrolase-like protein with peptidoglycan-binding domain
VLAAIAVAPEPVAPPTAEAPAAREEPAPAVEEAAAAPPPPPSVEAAPGAPAADAPAEIALAWAEVLEVQKRLVSVGINPGPLDGIVGPRTMGGVERYEELHGRPVTGRVDRRLLKLLQQDPDSSATLEARAR